MKAICWRNRRISDRRAVAFVLALISAVPTAVWSDVPSPCVLSAENTRFISTSLAGWERASREFLRLQKVSVPWIVLFDEGCVWHLGSATPATSGTPVPDPSFTINGEPMQLRVASRKEAPNLPDGRSVPDGPTAMTALYKDDQEPFITVSLRGLWRSAPEYGKDPKFEANLLGVLSHELTHAQQIVPAARRIRDLGRRYVLPNEIHDDVIEQRFEGLAAYRRVYKAEVKLLYRALGERNAHRSRRILNKALVLARARRNRYYRGSDAVYAELEDLFLNMEGVAVWTAYKVTQQQGALGRDEDPRKFGWARRPWSQEEGLVLLLLIDRLVPNWQPRILGPELISPFALLNMVSSERTLVRRNTPKK
jgi:hypothetical protein